MGNPIMAKLHGQIRLLLQNIGRINLTKPGSIKLMALHNFINYHKIDVAITECNTAWTETPFHLYLTEQTRYWWENVQWSISHNTTKNYKCAYQPGGTCLTIINHLSYRAQQPGNNTVGLGRWCWAQLRGKNNNMVWNILAYRPCKADGLLTTYQQQVRHWSKKGSNICPKENS